MGLGWFLIGVGTDAASAWWEGWRVESIVQDLRFALRTLARSPGFAVASVTTLALALGVATALFSLVEEAVLAEPPYDDPDRLVVVDMLFGMPGEGMNPSQWSYPRYSALRDTVTQFEDLAAYGSRTMTLTERGAPEVLSVEVATPSLFPLLGVEARIGRLFDLEEEDAGAPVLNALVSASFWTTRLGRSNDVIGADLTLDQLRFRIVGVLEDGYRGMGGNADVWIPFAAMREVENPSAVEDPWNQYFYAIGRLSESASLESAGTEVQAFGATLMDRFPPPVGAERLVTGSDVLPFAEARGNPAAATSVLALFAAVLLVLLIATANLAGLLLARGAARQKEAAVRASLGAGRARLVRQLLTESLTLAFLGGVAGMAIATLSVDMLGGWLADSLGTAGGRGLAAFDPDALSVDLRVFSFALVLTGGVGLGFGLLPAWQAARTDPNLWLRGGQGALGARQSWFGLNPRGALVAGQIALAVVLLSSASLMIRTTINLERVDLGFDRDRLLTATYSLSPADEQAGVDPAEFHTAVVESMRAVPGVVSASVGEVPMEGPTWRAIVLGSEGRPDLTPAQHLWIRIQPVGERHTETMGIRLLEGRDIEATDDWTTERVVVLGESAVDELFPNGSPLGQRVQLSWPGYGGRGATVVGVVEDVRLDRPGVPAERLAFVPVRQAPQLETGLLIRTEVDPATVAPAVRAAMANLAPNIALTSLESMDERTAAATVRPRVLTLLLTFFGVGALFLVAVGLYGSIAFAVANRTRELGLRASLGAGRSSLVLLVVRQGLVVTGVGLGLGIVGSVWATRFLESLAFGASTTDALGLVGVSLTLVAVAALAAYVPARRGTTLDPMEALRSG